MASHFISKCLFGHMFFGCCQRQKRVSHQGVKYGEGTENPPHQAYSGRTRQKSFRGRYLKKSPPSGSAVKTFDHLFVLCSADNLCPVFKTLCQPLWGLMLDH